VNPLEILVNNHTSIMVLIAVGWMACCTSVIWEGIDKSLDDSAAVTVKVYLNVVLSGAIGAGIILLLFEGSDSLAAGVTVAAVLTLMALVGSRIKIRQNEVEKQVEGVQVS
jgi:energy-converting hydrogenase Eha subunit E